MADCIVCEEREGTTGFGSCCTTECLQMTQASIEDVIACQDLILKQRQVIARQTVLATSVAAIGNVPDDLLTQLQEIALKDDGGCP